MERGNISNQIVPRYLSVWENLVGILPTEGFARKANAYQRLRQWPRTVRNYQLNEPIAAKIWNDTMRFNVKYELVTFLDPKAVEPIEEWVDAYDLPIPKVHYFEPDKLARKLAYMPDVAVVMVSGSGFQLKFGSKGRLVDPRNPHTFGVTY